MPRGRVAYKQYSLYCIGLQAVLATAYCTVQYTRRCYPRSWLRGNDAGGRFNRAGTCGSRPPLHDSAAQAVPKTRAPAVRASKKDHHRSHGAPSYIEAGTLLTRTSHHHNVRPQKARFAIACIRPKNSWRWPAQKSMHKQIVVVTPCP